MGRTALITVVAFLPALVPCASLPPPSPLYSDPVFDGAHDPEFVWHPVEEVWWLTYLQNRFNSPLSDACYGVLWRCTDLGLASTPDNGATWIYRGVMAGLDVPPYSANDTQQFGGATWWRPAVRFVNGTFHGFFTYSWVNGSGQTVVHYTSADLKHWRFEQIVPGDVGYDSVMYRLPAPDARYVLLSTNAPARSRWLSNDMITWAQDAGGAPSPLGEGPHVTDEFGGARWLNSELNAGGGGGGHSIPLLRSMDGGASWAPAVNPNSGTATLYVDDCVGCSQRHLDGGVPHQGPILVMPSPSAGGGPCPNTVGLAAFVLTFDEFNMTWPAGEGGANGTALFGGRSVLQVAAVACALDGGLQPYLAANRSAPFDWYMLPPPPTAALDRAPPRAAPPPVRHVALEDAAVIALAEANRWWPGLQACAPVEQRGKVQAWRNPALALSWLTDASAAGSDGGGDWRWLLSAALPGGLVFNATVAANGTVLALHNGTSPDAPALSPLRQWRRDPPLTYEWVGRA